MRPQDFQDGNSVNPVTPLTSGPGAPIAAAESPSQMQAQGLGRRGFLATLGGAAIGSAALLAESPSPAEPAPKSLLPSPVAKGALFAGKPLRVQPALVYAIPRRAEKTSWRPYGGLKSRDDVDTEAKRIADELKQVSAAAEFPLEFLPVALVGSDAELAAVSAKDCDAILVYASGGPQGWLEALASSKKPNVWFLRHRSGPFYLWYEIAHYRFLRKSEDAMKEPNMDVGDIVVDDYGEVLWRMRALYGLKNARGTKAIALGGLQSYSAPGQALGPKHVKEVWGYDIQIVPDSDVARRIQAVRADAAAMKEVGGEVDSFLAQPGVKLEIERRLIENTFSALKVFKEILKETGGANIGVANCMGSLIGLLDTAPCLVLSLLNDEGYTAFCHTDYTHTPPGVLLRWISGKPSFVSNSHFPHHGLVTLAHCSAPRRMNGRDFEPSRILTHFESDYGTATKVEYTRGQVTTNIVPNLTCTKWFGFRGKILDAPFYDICRSQIEMGIDGDWKKLLADMQGFHTVTCYGDYLKEVAYALKKTGIAWESVSEA